MFFTSDTTSGAHPAVLNSVTRANDDYALSYGADKWSAEATRLIRETFEAPEADVYFVGTGTAANALALSAITRPWEVIYCTDLAHIYLDECNGPEFFTGGAKLRAIPSHHALLQPEDLEAAIQETPAPQAVDMQRGPLSLTNLTEAGTLYSPDHVAGLTSVAQHYGLSVHMDGARFANAIAALGCTPAEVTWKAGIDILSFGGTKNGMMGSEAVVVFSPEKVDNLAFRRRRAAHLFSKQRFFAAQFVGALETGLWREMGAHANEMGQRLSLGLAKLPGCELVYPTQANMVFVQMARRVHHNLGDAGAEYGFDKALLNQGPRDALLPARLVTSWRTTTDEVDAFIEAAAG